MVSLETMILFCETMCNDPNVGYSQSFRNKQTKNGITYFDCSSLIWFSLIAGGFDTYTAFKNALGYSYGGNAFTTATMLPILSNLGFIKVDLNGEWKKGDILHRKGHTEMVYSGGIAKGVTMGAHSANYPLERQVSICNYTSNSSKWSSIWRYVGETASEEPTIIEAPVVENKKKNNMSIFMMCRRRAKKW